MAVSGTRLSLRFLDVMCHQSRERVPRCASDSPPSSVMISVIREDMMLGGPRSERGNCGKLSSLLLAVGERARGAPSPEPIVGSVSVSIGIDRRRRYDRV
jgi:hypothetical protein